jgi:hypothetical protein
MTAPVLSVTVPSMDPAPLCAKQLDAQAITASNVTATCRLHFCGSRAKRLIVMNPPKVCFVSISKCHTLSNAWYSFSPGQTDLNLVFDNGVI